MALSFTELDTLFKQKLHNDGDITGDQRALYLTLGQKKIVQDVPSLLGEKLATISIVASTREYSLASDFRQLIADPWIASESQPLYHMSQSEIRDWEAQSTIPSGPPLRYYLNSSSTAGAWSIKFDYDPDASYTLSYRYYWNPADINSTNGTGPVAGMGYETLVLAAALSIAREHNDPEGWQIAEQIYAGELRRARSTFPERPSRARRLAPGGEDFRYTEMPTNYPTTRFP